MGLRQALVNANQGRVKAVQTRQKARTLATMNATYNRSMEAFQGSRGRRGDGRRVVVSDELQKAVKSISYSDYVYDFINNTGFYEGAHYTDQQLEAAYRTSVYLFATLRRVANLFSEVRIVAEAKQADNSWERLPETAHLNMIFSSAGAGFMREMFLFYAVYGRALVYKRKTKKARAAYREHKIIKNYMDGGIAGVHIIPNVKWDIVEDEYRSEIDAFRLNEPDGILGTGLRDPDEFVYVHDFDFRSKNDAISMVSLALNNAITNAAIARWASQYFMSGAMPLLLVSMADDSPSIMTESDMLRYKGAIERAWQGIWSKFSLRAFFTDRKLEVQQAGIKAEDVQAPELNQDALNAMTSVFQIAPDLIVPPPGGTQERHKWLIMDAYNSSVLPLAWQFCATFNDAFGFDEHSNIRLVIDEESIRALEAERAENADTELAIYNAGIQTFGEAQDRLKIRQPVEQLKDWVMINGKLQSIERLVKADNSPDEHVIQYGVQAWDSNVIKLSEIRKILFNLDTDPQEDGFKFQVVPSDTAGDFDKNSGSTANGGSPDVGKPPPQLPDGGGNPPPSGGGLPSVGAPSGGAAPHDNLSQGESKPNAAPDSKPAAPAASPKPPDGKQPPDAGKRPKPGDVKDVDEDEPEPQQPVTITESHPLPVTQVSAGEVLTITPPAGISQSQTAHVPTSAIEPQSAYACLWLANDDLIGVVAEQLKPLVNRVDWINPSQWHVTLVYGGDCSDEQLKSILALTPAQCPDLHLRVSGLITFDTPDGICIALKVEPDFELAGLQNAMYAAFTAQRIPISPFSSPAAYTPHITLGYAPPETDVPEFTCNLVVEPQLLRITRGDYQTVSDREPITRWREQLSQADSWDGNEVYSLNNMGDRDRMYGDLLRQRGLMRSALLAWKTTGEPGPELRDQVRGAVRQAIAQCGDDSDRAWLSIMLALEQGHFDADSDLEDNPILIPTKAMQTTAKAELDAWENHELKGKGGRAFETHLVPMDVDRQVRDGLKSATTIKAKRAVFSAARSALATRVPDETNEATLTAWAARLEQNSSLSYLLDNP